jgi:hypothetical protein
VPPENDRPLLDRLGVKPGMLVSLSGYREAGFEADLEARGARVEPLPGMGYDLIFHMAHRPADLDGLPTLRRLIKENGAIWVLRVKGRARTLGEVEVIEAARTAGLVDNKIASFSDRLAAMRLVVPVALRAS